MVPSRRVSISVAALLAILGNVLVGCGDDGPLEGAAADIYGGDCVESTGESLTVYSGRTENLIAPVLEAFECERGIEISPKWASSTELALLLGEEGDRTEADVFISRSPGPIGFLESRDLLQEIDPAVLDLVDEPFRSDNGTWVGFSGRKRVLVYNVDEIDEGELPESVFELTEPEWEGKVALPATNGSFVDWFTVFRDQHTTEVATEWLGDMVANGATFYPNNRAIVEATGRGEIEVGLVNHYYNYQEAEAIGDDHRAENHDFASDDIGSLLIISAGAITASSDEAEAANELLAYLLSDPVQTYFTEQTFEYPLAAGVEPLDVLAPLDALAIGTVDYESLGGGFEETIAIIEESGIQNQ